MRKRKSKNGSGSYERHVFVDINLLCKFGEFMFIKEEVMKPFIKRDKRKDGHQAFYNLPSRAYQSAGDN